MDKPSDNLTFIVDDDPIFRKILQKYLENIGFKKLMVFEGGSECIEYLKLKPYIVFLDYQMDDMNGKQVLKEIMRREPNTVVIMISSQEDVTNAINTLKYGAFDYIVKGENEFESIQVTLARVERLQQLLDAKPTKWYLKLFGR